MGSHILLFLSIVLAVWAFLKPRHLIATYMLFHCFFLMRGLEHEYAGIKFMHYTVYPVVFCLLILLRAAYRFYKKQEYIFITQDIKLYFTVACLGTLLPAIWHLFVWKELPKDHFVSSVMSSWVLSLVFIDPKEFHFHKVKSSIAHMSLFVFLLATPMSVRFFHDYGLSLWRLHWRTQEHMLPLLKNYVYIWEHNGVRTFWFYFDELNGLIWGILSSFLLWRLFTDMFAKNSKFWIRGAFPLIFMWLVIRINQYAKMYITYILQILTFTSVYVWQLKSEGVKKAALYKKLIPVLLLAVFILITSYDFKFTGLSTLAPPPPAEETMGDNVITTNVWYSRFMSYMDWDKVEQVEDAFEAGGRNRIDRVGFAIMKLLKQPFIGYGYPYERNFTNTDLLPSGARARISSKHSDIVDRMLYFGIIFGLISSFFTFFPLYCLWKAIVSRQSGEVIGVTLCVALITIFSSLAGVYGFTTGSLAMAHLINMALLRHQTVMSEVKT